MSSYLEHKLLKSQKKVQKKQKQKQKEKEKSKEIASKCLKDAHTHTHTVCFKEVVLEFQVKIRQRSASHKVSQWTDAQ